MSKVNGDYPDDIHSYDDHPQSPFYVEPVYVSDCCGWDMDSDTEICLKCKEHCSPEVPEPPEPPERERWEHDDE